MKENDIKFLDSLRYAGFKRFTDSYRVMQMLIGIPEDELIDAPSAIIYAYRKREVVRWRNKNKPRRPRFYGV